MVTDREPKPHTPLGSGCCTRCGEPGGRDDWWSARVGWIEHKDRRIRLCPDCCTLDQYRVAIQPSLDAMDRARERGTAFPDWLFVEAARSTRACL